MKKFLMCIFASTVLSPSMADSFFGAFGKGGTSNTFAPRSIVCPNGQRAVTSFGGSDSKAALYSCGPTTDIGSFKTFNRL